MIETAKVLLNYRKMNKLPLARFGPLSQSLFKLLERSF